MELAPTDYSAPQHLFRDELPEFMRDAYNVVRQNDENGERVFFLREGKAYAYGYDMADDVWKWLDPETAEAVEHAATLNAETVPEDDTYSRTKDIISELALLDQVAHDDRDHERMHELRTELAKLELQAARESVSKYVET